MFVKFWNTEVPIRVIERERYRSMWIR